MPYCLLMILCFIFPFLMLFLYIRQALLQWADIFSGDAFPKLVRYLFGTCSVSDSPWRMYSSKSGIVYFVSSLMAFNSLINLIVSAYFYLTSYYIGNKRGFQLLQQVDTLVSYGDLGVNGACLGIEIFNNIALFINRRHRQIMVSYFVLTYIWLTTSRWF